jgi:hypothetical protein
LALHEGSWVVQRGVLLKTKMNKFPHEFGKENKRNKTWLLEYDFKN